MTQDEFISRTEQIKSRLYRTAFVYLGSEAYALDAVDEAVYKGLMSLKKLRQPEFFETWLTRILINVCKKVLKRRKREQPLDSIELQNMQDSGCFDSLPLKDAIHRLPQELREVIVLRYFSDFTLAATAQILGIPQGTAVTRQRRALQILRLELEENS